MTTARHWTFAIDEVLDEVLDEEQMGRAVVLVGRLAAGSVAFFQGGYFIVSRDGADIGLGHVNGVGATEDSDDFVFVAF